MSGPLESAGQVDIASTLLPTENGKLFILLSGEVKVVKNHRRDDERVIAVLGPVEAFHLKPRPLANPRGNITAEMWFAPSLQYLPVRIRVAMGDATYVDLMVDKIEQR